MQHWLSVMSAWKTVVNLTYRSGRARMALTGVMINETPIDEFYNLPFVLAYGALEDALEVLDSLHRRNSSFWRKTGQENVCRKIGP